MSDALVTSATKTLFDNGATYGSKQIISGWEILRDFNSGTVGQVAIGSDGFNGTATESYYSVTNALSGQVCELNTTLGETGFGKWGGSVTFPELLGDGDDLWVRVKTYFPSSFDLTTDFHLKFLRPHVKNSDESHVGYIDVYISSDGTFYYQNELYTTPDSTRHMNDAFAISRDTWETYTYHIKLSSTSGRVRFWQGNNLVMDNVDDITLQNSNQILDFLLLFTYWNGGAPATQSMYIDDLEISSQTVPVWAGGLEGV